MKREEAIEIIRKNMPSDKSLPVYEALHSLIPELAESEDERIRNKSGYYKAGKFWKAGTLWNAVKDKSSQRVPNRYILQECTWNIGTLQRFANEVKNVQEVSLDYPIILDMNGNILDGAHRVVKAYLEGKDIDIVYLGDDEWPEPDYDEEKAVKESEDERIRKELIDYLWGQKIYYESDEVKMGDSQKCRLMIDGITWLEKQKELFSPQQLQEHLDMQWEHIKQDMFDATINYDDYGHLIVPVDECDLSYGEKVKVLVMKVYDDEEKQKEQKPWKVGANAYFTPEQKPSESISQLTVQGKGVYKICPRCKERMVRDDSMIYTSMPPQYRYECPKCGESECDTVMYDNPEMEEQKPNSTEDMPYITDEHFYEREPADSFKYKLAEYMTRCCTKKEGPYGYEYGISAESILKMAEEELLKRGVVQKPAEWSKEDENMIGRLRSVVNECASYNDALDVNGDYCEGDYAKLDAWLKSLPLNLKKKNDDVAKLCSNEWSEEDEKMLKRIEDILLIADGDLSDKLNGRVSPITDSAYSSMKLCIAKCLSWLKSLRPSWKPTEHQMNILKAVKDYVGKGSGYWGEGLGSLIEDLKKL